MMGQHVRQTAAKMLLILIISAPSRTLYGPLDNDRLGALEKNKELGFEARVSRVAFESSN